MAKSAGGGGRAGRAGGGTTASRTPRVAEGPGNTRGQIITPIVSPGYGRASKREPFTRTPRWESRIVRTKF